MVFLSDVEHLQWVHTPKDADIAIGASLQWECKATGNPRPAYKWLKNGQILTEAVGTRRIKGRQKNAILVSLINHEVCFGIYNSHLVIDLTLVQQNENR